MYYNAHGAHKTFVAYFRKPAPRKLMGGKTGHISARISEPLRARITAINDVYGTNDAGLLEDAMSALADYVERRGGYKRPICVVHADEVPAELGLAADRAQDAYGDEAAGDASRNPPHNSAQEALESAKVHFSKPPLPVPPDPPESRAAAKGKRGKKSR